MGVYRKWLWSSLYCMVLAVLVVLVVLVLLVMLVVLQEVMVSHIAYCRSLVTEYLFPDTFKVHIYNHQDPV